MTAELHESLAARLRQAVQGCTYHIQGPVQAWAEIEEGAQAGKVDPRDVAQRAMAACERRLAELRAAGAREEDPSLRKEELTRRFIARLLGV